jgi:hypothetical protein
LIDAEAEAARLRKELKSSISAVKVKELLEAREIEYMDELKRARESIKTAALLQEEHRELADRNKELATANRALHLEMAESKKRQEEAVSELQGSLRRAEQREQGHVEQLKVANETMHSKLPSLLPSFFAFAFFAEYPVVICVQTLAQSWRTRRDELCSDSGSCPSPH